ncbi:MAG: ribonuclease Z [Corynebacterium sp.]|nr:ribonuclease Z [Corynebacterium sp.]
MQLVFLGTGSGAPTLLRNVSGLVLDMSNEIGELWLFDCGEATQHQMMNSYISPARISNVFITHMHGDHVFGLPGFLGSRSLHGVANPLTVYGPPGIKKFITTTIECSSSYLTYPLEIIELDTAGDALTTDHINVRYTTLEHGVQSYAYRITEADRPGELLVDQLKIHGITPGPIYGQLKNGGQVTLEDGTILNGVDFVGPPKPGHDIVIFGDTRFVPAHANFAAGAQVMVHEATYGPENADKAHEHFHSTSVQTAELARRAGVSQLILTHFSARYTSDEQLDELLDAAQEIFPNTMTTYDGKRVSL